MRNPKSIVSPAWTTPSLLFTSDISFPSKNEISDTAIAGLGVKFKLSEIFSFLYSWTANSLSIYVILSLVALESCPIIYLDEYLLVSGYSRRIIAAAAATIGEAIEVPLHLAYLFPGIVL